MWSNADGNTRRLTLVNVDTEHNVLMSTMRHKQKGFGPSPIQD